MINKKNQDYDRNKEESKNIPKHATFTDHQGFNDEFNSAFQMNYKKQDIDDISEAIKDFLDRVGNMFQNISAEKS